MKFLMVRSSSDAGGEEVIRFSGEFTASDLAKVRLDPIERALLDGCKPGTPADDHLLALETLFRRAREQGIT